MNGNLPPVQQLKGPNLMNKAAQIMQMQYMEGQLGLGKERLGVQRQQAAGTQNAAVVNLLKLQETKRTAERAEAIEANEFALSLLSGVNSEADRLMARGQFEARYPGGGTLVDQVLPVYSARGVEILRNSLLDETQKLKAEELGVRRGELGARETEAATSKYRSRTGRATQEQSGRKIDAEIRKIDAEIELNDRELDDAILGRKATEALEEAKLILEDKKANLEARKTTLAETTQTEAHDVAQAKEQRLAREAELRGFPAGTGVYREGQFEKTIPTKEDFELFKNAAGEQAYVKVGDKVPGGFTRVPKKPDTQVTVQTGDLTTATKSKLQEEIRSGLIDIQEFREIKKTYKKEYLTFWGKGANKAAEFMDKAGLSTDEQKEMMTERNKWFRRAKAGFIRYRKWATGVAGGEQELKEIATSFPDPVKNAPTQYAANLDSIDDTTRDILMLNYEVLNSGVDLSQPIDELFDELERKLGAKAPPRPPGVEKVIYYGTDGKRIEEK